jgi:hypothetical protein
VSGVADRWYKVITREQMNEAFEQYAYPEDAVLPPLVGAAAGHVAQRARAW